MSKDNPTALAVRGRLAERRRTQADAAAVLGISQASISRRLSGDTPFTAQEIHQLAAWLDIRPADLIGELDHDSPLQQSA